MINPSKNLRPLCICSYDQTHLACIMRERLELMIRILEVNMLVQVQEISEQLVQAENFDDKEKDFLFFRNVEFLDKLDNLTKVYTDNARKLIKETYKE